MSDSEPRVPRPPLHLARWLRLARLVLGALVSALTLLKLLGLL